MCVCQDHYYFFAADNIHRPDGMPVTQEVDQDLILNMYDIDPAVSRYFWHPSMGQGASSAVCPEEDPAKQAKWMTKASGIRDIFPDAAIHETMFEPCGYSMNGIEGEAYHTIHITPESHCSYASFETNANLASYSALTEKVVSTFRPGRFSLLFFADENCPINIESNRLESEQGESLQCLLEQSKVTHSCLNRAAGTAYSTHLNPRKDSYWAVEGYRNKCLSFHEFGPGYYVVLANYVKDDESNGGLSPQAGGAVWR